MNNQDIIPIKIDFDIHPLFQKVGSASRDITIEDEIKEIKMQLADIKNQFRCNAILRKSEMGSLFINTKNIPEYFEKNASKSQRGREPG